jgi:hypothetical protein
MEADHVDWISENLYALAVSPDEECKYIYALHLLLADVDGGGLLAYLVNSSADTFPHIRMSFDAMGCSEGKIWADELELAFGGAVPAHRDERIDIVLPMVRRGDAFNPFDRLSVMLDDLTPQLEAMLIRLVQQKSVDTTWRPDKTIRLGGHLTEP